MTNLDYLYNPEAAKDAFSESYFIDKKLGFQVIENGMILPHKSVNIPGHFGLGGIADSDGNFIESSSLHYGTGGTYTPPPKSIKHSSETVIYLAFFYRVWGHDLTDNIRRIWFLKSEFMKQFKNCPIVYIPYYDGTFTIDKQPSLKRLLEILEIDVDKLQPITQPTQFDKIILPDGSFLSPNNPVKGYTAEYQEMIDRVRDFALKNRTPTSIKKIYFFNGRKGMGEERIAEYFKSKGYEIIRPETLPLDEQLNLMINAKSLGSIGCSAAHNSLFMREDSEMIFIPRAASKFGYYQEILNQVRPLNVNYVDSSLSVFSEGIAQGNHCYIVSEQLKRFFGDKFSGYEDDDFKIFVEHFKISARRCLPLNPEAEEYYGSILPDFIRALFQKKTYAIDYPDMLPYWEKFRPLLSYQTHVSREGWNSAWIQENQISNDIEQGMYLQAIKINSSSYKVYYSVYYGEDEGWSKEVSSGEMAGTTGIRKPIYGIKIRLDDEGAKEFDILYRMHNFHEEWTPWTKNNEELISPGIKLNAIQIKLEPKIK